MQSIRSAIRGLQRWIADLNEKKQLLLDALEKSKEPTLSDLLVDYFNLRNEQRSDWSSKAQIKCTAVTLPKSCSSRLSESSLLEHGRGLERRQSKT